MRALWIAAGLVVSLFIGGPGWTEEKTRGEKITERIRQRHQLNRLLGTWKFRVDMSLTYPGSPGIELDFQYNIYGVNRGWSEDLAIYASGSDRVDYSQFIVRVRPRVIAGQTYNFSFFDQDYDKESRKKICFDYTFSQVGRYIFGYAKVTRESEKDYCTDVVGIGIVTGVREEQEATP